MQKVRLIVPVVTLALAAFAGAENPAIQKQPVASQNAQPPRVQSQRSLRQLGMIDLPGSPGFDQMAFAKGKLLLTHTAASTLDIVDPVKRRVIAQVVNLQSPRGIAVDQQNGKIYVAQAGNNSIAVVSFNGWQVAGVIPLPQPPTSLLLDDTGTKLYWASAQNNSISILDVTTRENIGSVDAGGRPRSMAWDQERGAAFVTLQDLGEVVGIDPKLQIVSRFKLNASQPTDLVYDARTRRLYVAVRYAVLSISDQDGTETNRVAAPAGVDGLWLDPESRTLYAAAPGSLLVVRAEGARLTAVDEIPSDIKAHTVAYDPENKMVFLPGGREGRSAMLLLRPMQSEQDQPTAEAKVR
jgi:YVTN family beta-propeller protein